MDVIVMESEAYRALMDRITAIEKYICEKQSQQSNQDEVWLDKETVCAYLKISKRTLQRYRSNRAISYSMVGKKSYYAVSEIKRLLEEKHIQRNEQSFEELAAKGLKTLSKE